VNSSIPSLTRIIKCQLVYAVTSLDDDVFVVRNNSQRVEVYDAARFYFQRHITVPELGSYSYGMTACDRNKCLYLSDWNNDSIHRVQLSGINAVKKWSVARHPVGLSVNIAHNLVVTCDETNKLQEYTTKGSLVREICLEECMIESFHAVQLSNGDYVVSLWTSPGTVSVVGVDGQVVHSYGQSQTSDVGQMRSPSSLAVTKNDDILVADQGNNRILSVNRSTGCVHELTLSVDGGIEAPLGLCLDESRGRLFVAEEGGQRRMLVFDGVQL